MKFFITTAIDYVNSLPHIGTAYEKIGADVLARFHRLLGDEVLFQMGNDEHSVNVQRAAEKEGIPPKEYCDRMKGGFESIWNKLHISCDRFIQTSDPKHHRSVGKFFEKIKSTGDIYLGDYEGLYCESCEAFYTEKDLIDGLCPQHKSPPKAIKEKNYFFKLSRYAEPLIRHIEAHPEFILPEKRRNEILNVIRDGLKDVSVSRSTFSWGIPLPSDPKHVVYVWFDALINYISFIGYADDEAEFKKWWPATTHIIGKDITRFHCVIWPAMLMSAGLELPRTVFGHGFVYLKGEKMSKSLGNVVTPLDVADQYGPDALRYYMMRGNAFGDDGNFTWEDFIARYNADLANGLGNLVSRTAGMITRYFSGTLQVPTLQGEDAALAGQFNEHLNRLKKLLNPEENGDIDFHLALEGVWSWITQLDQYIDTQAPWTLAKQKNEVRLAEVLTTVAQSLFYLAILLKSFIPSTAAKIWSTFGWEPQIPFDRVDFKTTWQSKTIGMSPDKPNLFPRIEAPK